MATLTYAPSPSKRKRNSTEASRDVATDLPSRPVARASGHSRKRSTVVAPSAAQTVIGKEGELGMQRHELARIFMAIETCLLGDRSREATFHSLRDAVAGASRVTFELHHLARISGVWPDCYRMGSATAVQRNGGARIPSISIAWPSGDHADPLARLDNTRQQQARKQTFMARLAAWDGQLGPLPELRITQHTYINEAKVNSIRRPEKDETGATTSTATPQTMAAESAESKQARQDALMDRIRARALASANAPTADERQLATLRALAPQAITSIKLLLASRTSKSLGMKELVDNLVTSLKRRIGPDEVARLIEVIALDHPHWCKIGRVGDVACIRFASNSP